MCTVSWVYEGDGYHLFCNRDERRTRKAALPPRIQHRRGLRFIAPVDGDFGGSWVGVNQLGMSLCLLNGRVSHNSYAKVEQTSRGLLLLELLESHSLSHLQGRIGRVELMRYQPFTLLALEPEQPPLVVEWTGRECSVQINGEAEMPLTSSSYEPKTVIEYRKRLFKSLAGASNRVDAELLYTFHSSHSPALAAYSPCMHRADAETVSFSSIAVARNEIEFLYLPQSPCRARTASVAAKSMRSGFQPLYTPQLSISRLIMERGRMTA
jgi:hypothetical protein